MRRSVMVMAALAAVLVGRAASAAEDCSHFAWNVAHERQLFSAAAAAQSAGHDAGSAGTVDVDRLYALTLVPQPDVHFVVTPGKAMLTDGAYGGVVRFHVEHAGLYRVVLSDAPWIDVVAGDHLLTSADFTGNAKCASPRKLVLFALQGGDYFLQFSGANTAALRLAITAAPADQKAPTSAAR